MFDWIAGIFTAVTIYRLVANFGGLVLVLISVIGYGLVVYKHKSTKYAYKFSFRQVFDLFNMIFFGAALLVGVLILTGVIGKG